MNFGNNSATLCSNFVVVIWCVDFPKNVYENFRDFYVQVSLCDIPARDLDLN